MVDYISSKRFNYMPFYQSSQRAYADPRAIATFQVKAAPLTEIISTDVVYVQTFTSS